MGTTTAATSVDLAACMADASAPAKAKFPPISPPEGRRTDQMTPQGPTHQKIWAITTATQTACLV